MQIDFRVIRFRLSVCMSVCLSVCVSLSICVYTRHSGALELVRTGIKKLYIRFAICVYYYYRAILSRSASAASTLNSYQHCAWRIDNDL